MSVNINSEYRHIINEWQMQARQALLGQSSTEQTSLLSFLGQQQEIKVSLALENVSEKTKLDLAAETAEYLSDQPEVQDNYVLVLCGDQAGSEWSVRTYAREDLVKDLEEPEKTETLEKLAENPLIVTKSAGDLPPTSEDPALAGLADRVREFVDKHEKLLALLDRQGLLNWS